MAADHDGGMGNNTGSAPSVRSRCGMLGQTDAPPGASIVARMLPDPPNSSAKV